MDVVEHLWPRPAEVELLGGRVRLDPEAARASERTLDGSLGPEGYALRVESRRTWLAAATPAGFAHAERTLGQLAELGEIPALEIRDRPAFARRGVMLDISRDRVPTLDSLRALVDDLARLKINELQLYTEHTFAYREHAEVWRDASPLTADEVRGIDAHCRARHVDLVPNQQSFGHWHRWLVQPRYRDLAECPEGVRHPFRAAGASAPEPFSLCPTDPRCRTLLAALYDELLPCFSSRFFHVGGDETFDLGQGRSARACRERGVGRVYLEFLKELHGLVSARGRRMVLWADILLHHAELVGELPRDVVPVIWGYEHDHPFEDEASRVARSGLDFYVCPGTSAWLSLGGRTANLLANVRSAANAGARHGALGLVVAEWGDGGHLQPPVTALPGFALAAGLAWNPGTNVDGATLAGVLDRHVLRDEAGVAGAALLDLGRTGEVTGARARNGSPLALLLSSIDEPFPPRRIEGLAPDGCRRAIEHAREVSGRLALVRSLRADALLVVDEMRWLARSQEFAARLGLALLEAGAGSAIRGLPAGSRAELGSLLGPLIEEHRRLWLQRSRPGGLERSLAWLERVRALVEGEETG
jgi:hypothetical protein